jgi:hypothetical protein
VLIREASTSLINKDAQKAMLAIFVSRARVVVLHLVHEGLSVLQYTDDTVIFMDNLERAKNMKLLLCAFEQLTGFKINFHRNELFCYGATKANKDEYAQIFNVIWAHFCLGI